jgi:cytochrome c553
MQPMASALSDDDINDLAAYYSTQTPTGLEADPSYWKAGEKLYRIGDRTRNIPACIACHGPMGAGNPGAGYPALRAQHAVYTVKQLTAYKDGTRYQQTQDPTAKSRNGQIMMTVAERLTAEDMRDLASYVQGMR